MLDKRISGIEIFEFDIHASFHYQLGKLKQCRYGLLKITCEGLSGWGECVMSVNDTRFELINWSSFLNKFKKLTIQEAIKTVKANQSLWGKTKTELVEMALFDLSSRLLRKLLIELAGLPINEFYFGHINAEECHIHPGCHGSLFETMHFAQQLKSNGFHLQIHKDYLIGPACSALQLLACRLGAEWKEVDNYPEPKPLCPVSHTLLGTGFQLDSLTLFRDSHAYFAVV